MLNGSKDPERPKQAVILAAGRGSRLVPYTDALPTALISIGGKSMVAHTISTLRRQGVQSFYLCRGWKGDVFDEHLSSLGDGVQLIDCPDFATTGMLESLRVALPHVRPGPLLVCYGDIIFRHSVARQLLETTGGIAAVVNAAAPGKESKGFNEVEVVAATGTGPDRTIRRIGKGRRVSECDCAGEFAGLVKFSTSGRAIMEEVVRRLFQEDKSCTGQAWSLPWWLEPVGRASLCDLLQLMADEGICISLAMVFGGWHEVNTPPDLTRAWNDTALFLSEEDTVTQVKAMGACLLSEANDLKRPLPIVAKELNVNLERLECLLKGNLEVSDALDIMRKMSEVYAVPLNDLWLDADDTDAGVRVFTMEASESSARILDRKDRTGSRTPYYEYRDAAMSRCSQFRPEWIKVLRVVASGDPLDPDVQMNNGHLMMQTTLFIGPVDFYYTDRHGRVHRKEMNTGDSNYISPFVPHSFTARAGSPEAIIIAVTYGGAVRRAFTELSRVGAKQVAALAGDSRNPEEARECVLKRCLAAECLSPAELVSALAPGVAEGRAWELLRGAEASSNEIQSLADVLNVRVSDLLVSPLEDEEEVVVTYAEKSQQHARRMNGYVLLPGARTRHQPDLKTFDLEVLESATPGESLSCGLHTFVYHFGSEAVELRWSTRLGASRATILRPGDSSYIAPLVEHSFSVLPGAAQEPGMNGAACGKGRHLFLVRIPGQLSGETLAEFATFSTHGRERVGAETVQWYN
ncbi:mpnS [Symbiodinium sp. CCMP2456]|nr:mpnS [Symbiodinium sp. CCMP2456]